MAGTAFSETKEPTKGLAVDLGGGVKMEMVLVPAGEFKMGADKAGWDWEKPVHKVRITKPFYLGKYEVTKEQWEAVMGNNPSRSKGPKNPVESVSRTDCQEFLVKLNAKAGEQGSKFVLPTEAQWEYACRAESDKEYCMGDDEKQLGEYAWYEANSGDKAHPVGEKKSNAWGLYDMHGNVWEWCQDWFGTYGAEAVTDPSGPATGSSRVFRGGSWIAPAGSCRSASRSAHEPGGRYDFLGLRASRVIADK
jgi:formylglycine-generating enzyme required for sulfatase activity